MCWTSPVYLLNIPQGSQDGFGSKKGCPLRSISFKLCRLYDDEMSVTGLSPNFNRIEVAEVTLL